MNINDYEKNGFEKYKDFAKTVKVILWEAIRSDNSLPQPQLIQYRAKDIKSLRNRLSEAGKPDTHTLELERRDLAGARVIFYTNNDIDLFLKSQLIYENFDVDEDSTKIYHAIPEKEDEPYRAIHYTVRLGKERTRLTEYTRFDGLRCEIQVQTILNHAWSETSHDIIYKNKLGGGYGKEAKKSITRRFDEIMNQYLIPAGFEIQKAQQEYERLLQGKDLFDKGVTKSLDNAENNNERYEILSALEDYFIPNHDDPTAAYEELRSPFLRAVKAALASENVPIKTTFGEFKGINANAVIERVISIIDIESLRYTDVIGTLQLLIDIYNVASPDDIREKILNVVKHLSEYNIDVYKQVGPTIQMELVGHLSEMSNSELESIRPIALKVWTETIKSDLTGIEFKADSVAFITGAVPVSDHLREVQDKAMKALFSAYNRSTDDAQKLAIISELNDTINIRRMTSNQAKTLEDRTRILEFVTEHIKATSYEILQHLEHQFLYDYFKIKDLTEDPGCQSEVAALMAAIFEFKDTVNADDRFVRYKVLVGFKSVFLSNWACNKYDYKETDEYRRMEANRYIEEINGGNANDWFDLIARCAETKSNDLATFPVFGDFIRKLAERKPEVAENFLVRASDDLRMFLPGFINGLALSNRCDIYERILDSELKSARNLEGVAHHLRYSNVQKPEYAARLLKRAIEKDDRMAVIECLLFAMEHSGTEKISDIDMFLRDALNFLNDRKDPSWVSKAWFLEKTTKFYEELTPDRTVQILQNLSYLPKVGFQVERILARLAKRQQEAIWDYFEARLARDDEYGEGEERFEAVPFEFNGLEKDISKDPQLAIRRGLSWFSRNPDLFQHRGGRLLSITFPNCQLELATALTDLVKAGGDVEAEFALAILENYHGETSTHVVLKEIVSRFPDDNIKMNSVRRIIGKTGVVSGTYGIAEAWQTKKESLTEWDKDERPSVKAFAKKYIEEFENMIASEYKRAETEWEMFKRNYDEDI